MKDFDILLRKCINLVNTMQKAKAPMEDVHRLVRTLVMIQMKLNYGRVCEQVLLSYVLHTHIYLDKVGETILPFGAVARLASREALRLLQTFNKEFNDTVAIIVHGQIVQAIPTANAFSYTLRDGTVVNYDLPINSLPLLTLQWALPDTLESLKDVSHYSERYGFEFKQSNGLIFPTHFTNHDYEIVRTTLFLQ